MFLYVVEEQNVFLSLEKGQTSCSGGLVFWVLEFFCWLYFLAQVSLLMYPVSVLCMDIRFQVHFLQRKAVL